MEIRKIVVTGGPCGGKSTALSWIQNAFSLMGYTVLFVPETATEFISGGVTPWTCGTNLEYQKVQMKLQLTKEELFMQAALTMKTEKILMVCDRGALDNRVYMNEEEFGETLRFVGRDREALLNAYDAVFHLVSAAKGAEEFYTTANNAARYESVEEAAAMDDRFIEAWTGHPHLRIIGNTTDFENKMKRLIAEIALFLGEPVPYDIERKFLIRYPDLRWLNTHPDARRIEILQTFLNSAAGDEIRVRRRCIDGQNAYYQTIKRFEGGKRIEIEKRLTKSEYETLLLEADSSKHQILKTRYRLSEQGRYYEIDLFPFWQDRAIMEAELAGEDEEVIFPAEVEVIEEVTGRPEYRNAAIASMDISNTGI